MAKDPVCGMTVDAQTTEFRAEHNGMTYSFCSGACKQNFEKNPSLYLKKKGWFNRFLEWLASGNKKQFGNKRPTCCGR